MKFTSRKHKLPTLAISAGDSLLSNLARHPRRVAAGVGALLLGTAVTAFGIAPLAPQTDFQAVREVTEPLGIILTSDLLSAPQSLSLYRSEVVRRDDTPQSLLQRLGVRDARALDLLRNHAGARQLFEGRSGQLVTVQINERQELLHLSARWLPDDSRVFRRLVIASGTQGLQARLESGELTAQLRMASGVVSSSLFAATDAANLPDSVAVQLAEIFANDFDFRRDLRQGDRFSVVYESLVADGENLRAGRVLSAEFFNNETRHDALWFEGNGQKGAYFSFAGQSSRKSYLGSPLEFSRVSSGYGMRFHPISGQQKAHLGVDYAAPTGTPVRSIGEGVVSFAGVQRGYGNVIEIKHPGEQSTLYAHLSRVDVRADQKVAQGEFIGAVGSTGASTGPHLHLEFKSKGVHMDPLEIARNSENISIDPLMRPRFQAVAQQQRMHLEAAATVQQASAE